MILYFLFDGIIFFFIKNGKLRSFSSRHNIIYLFIYSISLFNTYITINIYSSKVSKTYCYNMWSRTFRRKWNSGSLILKTWKYLLILYLPFFVIDILWWRWFLAKFSSNWICNSKCMLHSILIIINYYKIISENLLEIFFLRHLNLIHRVFGNFIIIDEN